MSLRSVQIGPATTRESLSSARLVRYEIQKEIQLLRERIRKLKAQYRWAVRRQSSSSRATTIHTILKDVPHEMQLSRRYNALNKQLRQASSCRVGKVLHSDVVAMTMQEQCLEQAALLHDAYKHQSYVKRRPWVRYRTISDREASRAIKQYRRAIKKAESQLAIQQLLLRQAQYDVVIARENHQQHLYALQQSRARVQQLLRKFAIALQVPVAFLQNMPLYVECHQDETLHMYIGNPREVIHGHIVLNLHDKIVYYRLPGEPHGRQNFVA